VLDHPTTDRRSARREATKAEILEAAWEIVRAEGLAALSLRDLARKVGMQAPSIYQYFDSKHAIYDAMFAQAWGTYLELVRTYDQVEDLRSLLLLSGQNFIEFSCADPARYQLMNQRTIPGFEPSPDSYAPAVEALGLLRERLAVAGITDQKATDLWTALLSGLVNQQIANDPGGDRWSRLVEDIVDMYVAHVAPRRRNAK
jgi:AcrR family transcriptional regulator